MTQVDGFLTALRNDGARVTLLHTVEDTGQHKAYQYIDIPKSTENILAALGPGVESDQLWLDEIKGKHGETQITCKAFNMARLSALLGL
jgi:hypothetical protein